MMIYVLGGGGSHFALEDPFAMADEAHVFRSPVAEAWSEDASLVAAAAHGDLVVLKKQDGAVGRRDVVNNAFGLGPLINHVGLGLGI